VAIDRPLCRDPDMPQVLSRHLSAVVEQVLDRHPVDRLFVEGGATAAALVRRLGWERLAVCREWATGVVSMEIEGQAGPLLTMKPGSYAWPSEILAQP
jgi:D-threonate/D-erythronate kinase